jgi:hypothetical protein
MSAIRRSASRLLLFVIRQSPAQSRSWGRAMLREMDFVDNDWAALLWALGSTTAICREAWSLQRVARWTASVLSGMAVAGVVLTISVMALVSLMRASWFEPSQGKLAEPLFVVVIPEAVYLLSAVALWRPQRRVACGILAAGAILITHSIVHFL